MSMVFRAVVFTFLPTLFELIVRERRRRLRHYPRLASRLLSPEVHLSATPILRLLRPRHMCKRSVRSLTLAPSPTRRFQRSSGTLSAACLSLCSSELSRRMLGGRWPSRSSPPSAAPSPTSANCAPQGPAFEGLASAWPESARAAKPQLSAVGFEETSS